MAAPDQPSPRRAGAIMLARYRPTTSTVEGEAHLLPLPLRSDHGQRQVINALCGRELHIEYIETVLPGQSLWCSSCFVSHAAGDALTPSPATTSTGVADLNTVAGRRATGVAYQRLGWPVTLRHSEVALNLDLDADAVALVIPTALSFEVAEILTRRRCPPSVLAHPARPTHRVIIAGERYPVPLAWPTGVDRVTGILRLPPTVTTHGPLCWVRPPQHNALRLCREIDVAGALRTALTANPPTPEATDT